MCISHIPGRPHKKHKDPKKLETEQLLSEVEQRVINSETVTKRRETRAVDGGKETKKIRVSLTDACLQIPLVLSLG